MHDKKNHNLPKTYKASGFIVKKPTASVVVAEPRKRLSIYRLYIAVVLCIIFGGVCIIIGATVVNKYKTSKETVAPQAVYESTGNKLREVATAGSSVDKMAALSDLVWVAYEAKRYDEALGYAEQNESLSPTGSTAYAMGMVLEKLGRYEESVKYYDIALSRTAKPTSGSRDSTYNDYLVAKQRVQKNEN